MKIKTIDKDIVLDTIRELLDTFTKQSKLPMLAPKQISKELSSAIQYEHNRYRIVLGTKDLSSYKYNKQIPEQLFVEKIISCFHEDRHLQQQFAFRQSSCNEEIKFMAHTDLLRISIPECYQGGILALSLIHI